MSVPQSFIEKFANKEFPKFFQCCLNKAYVWMFKIDMEEYTPESPCEYKTLKDLFIRKKKEIEIYDENDDVVVSPCDAMITEYGEIEDNKAYQIKGKSYDISELIPYETVLEDGFFINLYLSPSDYHRYHVPVDMQVLKATHIPGELLPVKISTLEKKENVFVKNERVVLNCRDSKERVFYFVAVGAMNVGKIFFNFDERIQTNAGTSEIVTYEYDDIHLKKGEELGRFELGSTILLFFGKEHFKYLNQQEYVVVGDIIGEIF